jgi:hypothetical protein
MCARGSFNVWMPVSVADVVKASFRAARAAAKRWLSAGECLVTLAEHFVETWIALLKQANTLQRRIRARDRHFCQVPGCSRAAVHAHHIKPRSLGGSDAPSNLISLCAAHHLHGIHGGRMRVTGTAPDKLVWEFGLRRKYYAAASDLDLLIHNRVTALRGLISEAASKRDVLLRGRPTRKSKGELQGNRKGSPAPHVPSVRASEARPTREAARRSTTPSPSWPGRRRRTRCRLPVRCGQAKSARPAPSGNQSR